jgi:hypothetical protein
MFSIWKRPKHLPKRRKWPVLQVERLEERAVPAITNLQQSFSMVEGVSSTAQVGLFVDTANVPITNFTNLSINWGDGTVSGGTIVQPGGAGTPFGVMGTHTYFQDGGANVVIQFHDVAGNTNNTLITNVALTAEEPNAASAGAPTVFSDHGGDNMSGNALAAEQAFETASGGVKNTAPAPQANGFRVITWDAVKLDGTDFGGNSLVVDAGKTVAIPINRFQAQGSFFETAYAVSGDGFQSVNPNVKSATPALFPGFSPSNVFAMFNDNSIDFNFVVPSDAATTPQPAATRGFGAIFRNVELANSTSIEYFSGSTSLGKFFVPAGAQGEAEFLGVLFPNAVVTHISITLGTDVLFNFNGKTFSGGGADNPAMGHNLAVTDDFVYPEPVPLSEPALTGSGTSINALKGVALSNVTVATFSHGRNGELAGGLVAIIDWGDHILSRGTIALTSAGYTVSGSHVYTRPGNFTITVGVFDDGVRMAFTSPARVLDALPDGTRGTAEQRFAADLFQDLVGQPLTGANVARVARLLGRGGLRGIERLLASHAFRRQIETNIITVVFEDLLSRGPTAAEVKFALHLLSEGLSSRVLVRRLLNSAQAVADKVLVEILAGFFIGQPLSPARLSSFVTMVSHGVPDNVVLAMLLNSPEFRAQTM